MNTCPVCSQSISRISRYSNYVCNDCIIKYKIKDINDNEIYFENINISGGIQGKTKDGFLEPADNYICYINKIKCHATEYRFGGIIICAII